MRDERGWEEQLGAHRVVFSQARGRRLRFIVEANFGDSIHACSVGDLCRVLSHVPGEDWAGLDTIVLRQPTRKQCLLRPAWARICCRAHLGRPGSGDLHVGPAIMIDAIDCHKPIVWPTSLQPADRAELERLRQDGHDIRREGRRYVIRLTPASARATQLYRSFLHEIGHWVDFTGRVKRPAEAGFDGLSRAWRDREAFAHGYARRMAAHLCRFGIIPFDPIGGSTASDKAASAQIEKQAVATAKR